jgi:hypothetical protein
MPTDLPEIIFFYGEFYGEMEEAKSKIIKRR